MSVIVNVVLELIKSEHQKCIDNNDRDYSYFHPSEFYQCVRALAYKYYRAKSSDKIKPDLQRIFDNGHYMHDRYTEYFRRIGILQGVWECSNPLCGKIYGEDEKIGIPEPDTECECGNKTYKYKEVKFLDLEHMMGGAIDGILSVSGGHSVIDYKSMNSNSFTKLSKPLDKHIIQVSVYMWAIGVDKALLLYENKDTQRIKLYEVKRDDAMIEKILKRALSLKGIVEKKKLPKRPFKQDSSQCASCHYFTICWKQPTKTAPK